MASIWSLKTLPYRSVHSLPVEIGYTRAIGYCYHLVKTAMCSEQLSENSTRNSLLAWLQLFRIANLPTALSNILMAFLLANGGWSPSLPLVLLLFASASLYTAGMVLNDVYDVEIDREQRPSRPLPAGAISVVVAKRTGFGLLLAGVVLATLAGLIIRIDQEPKIIIWRPGVIALLLAICIFLYDSLLKKTMAAPVLMGLCRAFNVLLGASTIWTAGGADWLYGFSIPVIWVAMSICVLIAGVTWFARHETKHNAPRSLVPSGTVLLLGIVGLAILPFIPNVDFPDRLEMLYPVLILLVSIPIVRKTMTAVVTGRPKDIQLAVVSVLRSLIILDASICYLAAPGQVIYALVVACLLFPSIILGRKTAST